MSNRDWLLGITRNVTEIILAGSIMGLLMVPDTDVSTMKFYMGAMVIAATISLILPFKD